MVKWFVNEEHSDHAEVVRTRYAERKLDLLALRILEYEVASAMRLHPIVKFSRQEIFSAVVMLRRLQAMTDPSEQIWNMAVQLSLSDEISLYDAIYLAVTKNSEGKMITSHETLYSKLSEKTRSHLMLLRDFNISKSA